ncbi:MAG: hypothetical protein ACRETP_14390 [Steroidobacteraceae bacterium]
MREIVILIPDLYLARGTEAQGAPADLGPVPGLEYAGRFGERAQLAGGWREWLARWVGHEELAQRSVAAIAAASLAPSPAPAGAATLWIATPVRLIAGLTRVHLDHRGIVRLPHAELTVLAADFYRTFGASGLALQPLCDGNLLLAAPGLAPVATVEPARCAGGEVTVPHGPAAAPLLRLAAEIEMWLHGAALNEARAARGESPVTALWLWGAERRAPPPGATVFAGTARVGPQPATLAFGSDAYLRGLWHLHGEVSRPLPGRLEEVLAQGTERAVLVVEVADELRGNVQWTVAQAVAELDRRLIGPVLRALRDGVLERMSVVVNDTLVAVGRRSGLKRWRRPRAGLAGFA